MRIQNIQFPNNHAICVFPNSIEDIPEAITGLNLLGSRPVIVLIGAFIQEQHLKATQNAIQAVAQIAEESKALVISGGTDFGIMALMGQVKAENQYGFPLLGVTVENKVTWPQGPKSWRFLRWGRRRWPLAQYYTHFILVPGDKYGDESSWIIEIATQLSQEHMSVTVLSSGGAISRKDVDLSLARGRPVIAFEGTGRLADEFAAQTNQSDKMISAPTGDAQVIIDTIRNLL
jgi:hypothetical protein